MERWLCQAYDLLRRLGVTAEYKGYAYAAYAVALCAERPELLQVVTKDLYPEVARRYRTTWHAVERNIRTVIAVAWKRNPAMLDHIAGGFLKDKPNAAQFLAVVTEELRRGEAGENARRCGRCADCSA